MIQNDWGRIHRSDGDIEEVYEMYITNLSAAVVNLELQTLNQMTLTPSTVSIEPGKVVKTDSLVRVSSVYKDETPYVLRYRYQGIERELTGTANRLSVEDLKKYKK